MTTGDGIFLGFLFFSLVLLYKDTKDRWNWEKLVKNILLGIACVAFITLCYVFKPTNSSGTVYEEWTWSYVFIRIFAFLYAVWLSMIPKYVVKSVCKVFNINFQFDKSGFERKIYSYFDWLTILLFLFLMFYHYDLLLESSDKLIAAFYKSFR
jgi:hypothetical protein